MNVPISKIKPDELQDARVTVMGLGQFGGGAAAARYLAENKSQVTVTDVAPAADFGDVIESLKDLPLQFHMGGHDAADFTNADIVVANPAIRRDHSLLQLAHNNGATISSEIALFAQACPARVIGVTGSNGKSTTTQLLANMLKEEGHRVHVGGNIGRSLLTQLPDIAPEDDVVLELSSFQLHDLHDLKFSPRISVVTNFSANHLDWHGSMPEYRRAKQAILKFQSTGGIAVLNDDDPEVSAWPARGDRFGFGTQDFGERGVFIHDGTIVFRDDHGEDAVRMFKRPGLPGPHNLSNLAAACCAAWQAGVSVSSMRTAAIEFSPLPHRLQFVAEISQRRFLNDSISTTPESTIAALNSFHQKPILIVGGKSKGLETEKLTQALAHGAKAVVFIGTTAELLVSELTRTHESNRPPYSICQSMDEAVRAACKHSAPGDIVVLSPGFSSYDWFRNFADRGDQYSAIVKQLAATDFQ